MARSRLKALSFAAGALLIGGAAYYYWAGRTTVPVLVTEPLTRGEIVESVGATGTLEAVTTVQVGTQVSGTVQALYADFNDNVRKGRVIARLDPSLYQTQVEQARANLERAKADVDRLCLAEEEAQRKYGQAKKLADSGLLPPSDLDTARLAALTAATQLRSATSQVTQAEASLRQATVTLDKTVITAPIDGVVIARNVDVGQTVAASLQAPTLFVLAADLTKLRVNASVHEADIGRIRAGQSVHFRVDAYPSDDFVGAVTLVRLNPIVQQNVVTYATVIDVPNPDLKLIPGMTATVTIRIAERQNALRLPNSALRFRPSAEVLAHYGAAAGAGGAGGQVWVESDGRLTSQRVRVGITDGTWSELLSGDIPEGAHVVTGLGTAATTATPASSSTNNPLMGPQRPPGGGRGGGR